MTLTTPTVHQLAILSFIANGIRKGSAPSIREIGAEFGIRSTNGVNDILKALRRKGCLEKPELKARSYRVTSLGRRYLGPHSLRCHACGAEVWAS